MIILGSRLTSNLKDIKVDDEIGISEQAVGALTHPSLRSKGKWRLMLSSGQVISPFVFFEHEKNIKIWCSVSDFNRLWDHRLQCTWDRVAETKECLLVGEYAQTKLRFYNSVTRESHAYEGRIEHLIETSKIYAGLWIKGLNPDTGRIIIYGLMAMLKETKFVMLRDFLLALAVYQKAIVERKPSMVTWVEFKPNGDQFEPLWRVHKVLIKT